jgi:hypothetical protein
LSLEFQSHPVNEKQIYNLSSLPGQKLELYSPFYPSGYGQGVNSETLVTLYTINTWREQTQKDGQHIYRIKNL